MITSHMFKKTVLVGLALLAIQNLGCAPTLTKTTPDFIEPLTSMDFVFVAGGTFKMGDPEGTFRRELPVHDVTISDFHVSMYEVTFTQYDEFCEATGYEPPYDEGWGRQNRPVINVSWEDANAYAAWLSKETGISFSLPSESQWEYFARAGTTTSYWMGRKIGRNRANCKDCGSQWDNKSTAPVGSFRANPWGVFDTAGNVHEWCLDSLTRGYQGAPQDSQPWLTGDTERRINRGGAWNSYARYLRSSARDNERRNRPSKDIGFRLIMNLPQTGLTN